MNGAILKENIFQAVSDYCEQKYNFEFDRQNPIIRLHEPTFKAEEVFAWLEPMLETKVTMGARVKKFETEYASSLGYEHCVMNNSGSSANLLAVSALCSNLVDNKLKKGDEVIVPALSWSTTIWPLIQNGLKPVFVDCDPNTWNIDTQRLKSAISKKTKAIKLVHVYGNPCDMDEIMDIANNHNLLVLEDSCESMGALYKGQSVGSFGIVGTFSLYFSHHITTLEGGLSVTDSFEVSEAMRIMRSHGWSREAEQKLAYEERYSEIDPRFIFIETGYNLRPTECQGSMGSVQLKKLPEIVKIRRRNAQYLIKNLTYLNNIFDFQNETENADSSWFGFGIILKDSCGFTLKSITSYLQMNNIETRPIIAGNMTRHPAFDHIDYRTAGSLKTSSRIMDKGFAVGCHHALSLDALDYLIEHIVSFVKKHP